MAEYDTPNQTYDSGAVFDDTNGQPIERKRMAKVKLGLASMSPDDVVSLANQIKTAMTGNANFPSPNPDADSAGHGNHHGHHESGGAKGGASRGQTGHRRPRRGD